MVICFFFFNATATTEIYTLSLHDALPICEGARGKDDCRRLGGRDRQVDHVAGPHRHRFGNRDRKSTRLNSSHTVISYAVFCLKKKKAATEHPDVVQVTPAEEQPDEDNATE